MAELSHGMRLGVSHVQPGEDFAMAVVCLVLSLTYESDISSK